MSGVGDAQVSLSARDGRGAAIPSASTAHLGDSVLAVRWALHHLREYTTLHAAFGVGRRLHLGQRTLCNAAARAEVSQGLAPATPGGEKSV